MSRSNYTDDGDHIALYRGNVDRSMRSKAGRARLAELLADLDAMPVKALAADVFVDPRSETAPVCALAAWAVARTGTPEAAAAIMGGNVEPDADEMARRLKPRGWPALVVQDLVYENDRYDTWRVIVVEGPARRWERWPVRYDVEETEAERWSRVRRWVARTLDEIAAEDARIAAWKATHPYTTPSRAGVGLL